MSTMQDSSDYTMRLTNHVLPLLMALAILWGFAESDPLHQFPGADLRPVGHGNLYFVALIRDRVSEERLCTGTLISTNQVLTSATCLEKYSDLRKLLVTFGSIGSAIVRKDFDVIHKRSYQDWCKNDISCSWDVHTNDISILRLKVADTTITPASIDYGYKFESGNGLKVIGWGVSNERLHPYSPKRGFLEVLSKDACEQRVRRIIRSCFSNFELPQQVSCAASDPAVLGNKGDFGGPVLREDHRRGTSILGILIQRCPIVETNDLNENQVNLILHLSAFEEFIKDTIGN